MSINTTSIRELAGQLDAKETEKDRRPSMYLFTAADEIDLLRGKVKVLEDQRKADQVSLRYRG